MLLRGSMLSLCCAVLLVLAAGCANRRTPRAPAAIVMPPAVSSLLLIDASGPPIDPPILSLLARPVDPVTLADRPGYVPLNFGHHYIDALSPNRRTLAIFIWPDGPFGGAATLHLIDLASWTDTRLNAALPPAGDGGLLTFSNDGQELYWVKPGQLDATHGIPRDYTLQRYDLRLHAESTVLALPAWFAPTEFRVLSSGRLAIYMIAYDADGLAQAAPQLLFVDPAGRRITTGLHLDGLKAGQYREAVDTNENPYRTYQPGLAWDMQRERLYVVHADSDEITIVDLAEAAVLKQGEIQPRSSLLDRILRRLASPAEAKTQDLTSRQAALSPDGRRLYITGEHIATVQGPNGQWSTQTLPAGLQVVDTSGLGEVGQFNQPVTSMALSPDGRWLLLVMATAGADAGQTGANPVQQQLTVLDAARLLPMSQTNVSAPVILLGFSADSRAAYLSHPLGHVTGTPLAQPSWEDQVLALPSGQVVADRQLPGVFGDILLLPSSR